MLMVMMYHHINSDDKALSNDPDTLRKHFTYIKENFNVVLPGAELSNKKPNICLTYDDAYYDFYHYVYPLLKELDLKAVLAVPVKFILEQTDLDAKTRMSLKHNDIYAGDNFQSYVPFCTYEELREMQNSGLVEIASHSYTHANLVEDEVDLAEEIGESKKVLEEHLGKAIETFVLPFGKYNDEVVELAKKHYPYVMRIGNGVNSDFSGINGLIYRVNGDGLEDATSIFSWQRMMKFRFKSFVKKVFG